MSIYHSDSQLTLHNGDALEVLRGLPSESVNCCVTSPPYFGLRNYNVDGQIGLEPTPEEFIARLVDVFREVRRVLTDDGTCWVNIGDSYAATSGSSGASLKSTLATKPTAPKTAAQRAIGSWKRGIGECKPKDLIGIPWMLAFALRADGWFLRQDIIWSKPNPMPESVTDRCTKSHEYVFMLSRSSRYFYDADAIKEPAISTDIKKFTDGGTDKQRGHSRRHAGFNGRYAERLASSGAPEFRNRRSVWSVATNPYPEAHFATYPPELIRPCILAGCPVGGVTLDPFAGSGTTGEVANKFGRKALLIELNPEYCELIMKRNCQKTLFAGAEVAA